MTSAGILARLRQEVFEVAGCRPGTAFFLLLFMNILCSMLLPPEGASCKQKATRYWRGNVLHIHNYKYIVICLTNLCSNS